MCVLCSVFLPLFPPQCGVTQTSFPPPFPLLHLLFCRAAGTKKVNFMEALWREGKRGGWEWDCTPAFGRTECGRGISGSDFPSLFPSSAILPRRRPTDYPLPDLVRPPPPPFFSRPLFQAILYLLPSVMRLINVVLSPLPSFRYIARQRDPGEEKEANEQVRHCAVAYRPKAYIRWKGSSKQTR